MRNLLTFLLPSLLFIASPWSMAGSVIPESTRVEIHVVLKVGNREQVFDRLVTQAQQLQGYFSLRTDDELTLRIPTNSIDAFKHVVEGQGIVADYAIASQHHGDTLRTFESLIQAKQTLLSAYADTLHSASNVDGVLSVEKAMVVLTEELETIVNEKNNIEQQLALATFHVSLQFRDRSAPHSQAASSFPWLNELGLPQLLGDFK